jgi:circadian clock protein KaiC
MALAARRTPARSSPAPRLEKTPSGIAGLDQITGGGLPKGRPTLVVGSAGCGKTLLAIEFLVRGALEHDEPGIFVSFEETADELAANVASLGYDLPALVARRKLLVDHVVVERSEIEETGEYDLGGLFVRVGSAIDEIGAKRVALDSVETLFAGLRNAGVLRAELKRLFRWLKSKGVTAIITGEQGAGTLTRHGLEEYLSDCVVLLDHRVTNQIATRRIRVVKYRGSRHNADEYPFLIDDDGFSVLPITSLGLDYRVSRDRVSSGVAGLDEMLGGKGYYRGSTVLVSGTAGTGKTSIAAHFAEETCRAGRRCLYFALEESPGQLARNMRSIGLDLDAWTRKGLLRLSASRPSTLGLEMRLLSMHGLVREFRPAAVVIDPVSNLVSAGTESETKAMLTRLVDYLKNAGVTALFTSLTPGAEPLQETEVAISSLIDTWILLRDVEAAGARQRSLAIVKSRGMAHSNEMREFQIGKDGIRIRDRWSQRQGGAGDRLGRAAGGRERP